MHDLSQTSKVKIKSDYRHIKALNFKAYKYIFYITFVFFNVKIQKYFQVFPLIARLLTIQNSVNVNLNQLFFFPFHFIPLVSVSIALKSFFEAEKTFRKSIHLLNNSRFIRVERIIDLLNTKRILFHSHIESKSLINDVNLWAVLFFICCLSHTYFLPCLCSEYDFLFFFSDKRLCKLFL